jgi:acetyl-CoA C-acetyltransferase
MGDRRLPEGTKTMGTIDPRTPVIIGAAQQTVHRHQQPGPEPLAAWEATCRLAVVDAGVDASVASQVDGILLADCMSWRYDDPVARLADKLGASPWYARVGAASGTSGQTMVDKAVSEIRAGRADLMLVCGGEMLATARHYRQAGRTPPWSHPHPVGPDHPFDLAAVQHPGEVATGLTEGVGAVYGFAMRDIARRAHLGVAPDVYRQQLGELMAGMTRVAATNPHAWFPQAREFDEIASPGAENRMITYPYTKRMVAIIDVDMSAALLVASQAWADAHAVPAERRIYPWASCYAEDPVYIAERRDLWHSPAMKAASEAVLRSTGLHIDQIDYIDVYSCFPSAVNFARDALGIPQRGGDQVTVTGGLPYAGGPASSYMLTSIVAMLRKLRANPQAKGMVSGVGMMMSHHIYAIYAAAPPGPAVHQPDAATLQARLDALPRHLIDDSYVGPAQVATYTVMHDREGRHSHGAAICDLPNGARCYARFKEHHLLEDAECTEWVGRAVEIAPGPGIRTIVRLL